MLGMEAQRFADYVFNNNLQHMTPQKIEGQLQLLMKLFKCTREVATAAVVGQGRCAPEYVCVRVWSCWERVFPWFASQLSAGA